MHNLIVKRFVNWKVNSSIDTYSIYCLVIKKRYMKKSFYSLKLTTLGKY